MYSCLLKMGAFNSKLIALVITFSLICTFANAQKLPNKQMVSLREPENVKIDGKSTEWNNTFQAYNNNTEVFYTIANNDTELYLTVHAVKPLISEKIIMHNITFTVYSSVKKSGKEPVSISYPLLHNNTGTILMHLKENTVKEPNALVNASKQNDSIVNVMNQQLVSNSKKIQISGLGVRPDSLISIYNEMGIKVAVRFDNQKTYTYELAIPLKALGLSIDKSDKFKYNVRLNGWAIKGASVQMSPDGRATERYDGVHTVAIKNTPGSTTLDFPTDFSGEYALAKK